MATSYEDKIKEQARPFLEDGEQVRAAFITQPRGTTGALAGGSALAGRKIRQQHAAASEAGLRLANPMALTDRRLMLSVSRPVAIGKGGDVKELVSAVPLADVDSIEVKRLLLGKTVSVVAGGTTLKLEANAGANAQGLADEFAQLKADAHARTS